MLRFLAFAVGVLAFAVPAVGQGEHHAAGGDGPVFVLHDGPDDGFNFVGNLAHFGYLVVGDDGLPLRHQDARLAVTMPGGEGPDDDLVLFDSADMHDYDGLQGADVVFPVPGPYVVIAEVETDKGTQAARFEGVVAEPPHEQVSIVLSGPGQAAEGRLASFSVQLRYADGGPVEHGDARIEVRRATDDLPVLRTRLHSHDGSPMEFAYAFPSPGAFTVTATAYLAFPSKADAMYLPQVATAKVMVNEASPPLLAPDLGDAPRTQPVDVVENGPYALFGTYDPDAVQTPFSPVRLSVTFANATTSAPVPHVNFEAALVDPYRRTVFHSDDLHEYDGVLEVLARTEVPGRYRLTALADFRGWQESITLTYHIVAGTPADGIGQGPMFTNVVVPESPVSGKPVELRFRNEMAGGRPYGHSEVEFALFHEDGAVPAQVAKLHTHGSGDFAALVTFPWPGSWTVRVDPITLHGEATPAYYGPEPGSGRAFAVEVAAGEPLRAAEAEDPFVSRDEGATPAAAWVTLLALAGAAALLARRR